MDDDDDDDDDEDDEFVEEHYHDGQYCNMCNQKIWSFHLRSYYSCESCDYSLHKVCAELPRTHQNHPAHPSHLLIMYSDHTTYAFTCSVCHLKHPGIYGYYCYDCEVYMDLIWATMSERKTNHPSHPHQLDLLFGRIVSDCVACGNKHEGEFFQCAICPIFRISLDCALLPAKLIIQNHTNGAFTDSHPLTLCYSFPKHERIAKFDPRCRVCDNHFYSHLWIYKCDKCRYYVHVDCATSKREPFMSIFLRSSLGKTHKNFKEDEHPNLLHCPFQDEGDNLLKRHMSKKKKFISEQHAGKRLNHSLHPHPLILFNKQTSDGKETVSLHDPMKRIQLLCDGCVKPIMTMPFYRCCQYVDKQCRFVLHEWCAKLPLYQVHASHPEHTVFLGLNIRSKFFGVFKCAICKLPSNGFAYGCAFCEFYIDINCVFIPEKITHEAHANHLLSKLNPSTNLPKRYCNACSYSMDKKLGFYCPSCDFYIHVDCALLLPKVIRHKCDKHPLSLRYVPAENHISEYFCEVCEDEFNPWQWFYHCTICDQSMHAACAPLILQNEQATYNVFSKCVQKFLNIKFGGTLEIKGHSHRLAFVQGLQSHDTCDECMLRLKYNMIFKCLECEFAIHYDCASSFGSRSRSIFGS